MNDTRQHILQISLILFLQKSFKEVTMREIVEKSGLSKGAFYHYFRSKEDLFKEIVTMFFTMGRIDYSKFDSDSFNTFYNQYCDHIDNSMNRINSMFDSGDKMSPNIFMILFDAIGKFPEFLEMELDNYHVELREWIRIVSKAREEGEITSLSSDAQIAKLFLYCTDGVFIRFVNSAQSANYKSDLLSAFDTIYNGIKV